MSFSQSFSMLSKRLTVASACVSRTASWSVSRTTAVAHQSLSKPAKCAYVHSGIGSATCPTRMVTAFPQMDNRTGRSLRMPLSSVPVRGMSDL